MSLLGKPRRKLSWDALAARLHDVGPRDITFSSSPDQVGGPHDIRWVAWHEGPSIATVQAAVGDIFGWEWRAVAPSTDPSIPPAATGSSGTVLWVRRSLSIPALATALVRFYGAHGRYFTTGDERGREKFARICDVDDPARSGFAIVDSIAATLVAQYQSAASETGTHHPIDQLSDRLRTLGYENLWAEAFKQVS